jgi:hypothetical protein
MKLIMGTFIFCVVLFMYLHIQFHLKTGDDLEIYEIDQASKDKLEEICDLRQPVMFDLENPKLIETTNKAYILKNYPVFEIKIRSPSDTEHVPLSIEMADSLFREDKTASYFSERNEDFLLETGINKHMQYNDEFLRPPMVSNCYYDILMGTSTATTPFRYELNYRTYFAVTQGTIRIKMSPPKSGRYLYPINDYDSFEFRSQINPWSVEAKYRADFDKIKCLELVLFPGKCLFIPAYWWYSIQFGEDSSVSMLSYRTYMNTVAIMPSILMCWLQNQNIKREVVKKVVPIASKKNEPKNEPKIEPKTEPKNEPKIEQPINEVSIEKNQEIV